MKDETKMKLKKAAKVCGLIAGFLATFVLGMGFGSCSEKKLQDQSSQRQSQLKRVAPKMGAVDGIENLVDKATAIVDGYTFDLNEPPSVSQYGGRTYVFSPSVLQQGKRYVVEWDGYVESGYGLVGVWSNVSAYYSLVNGVVGPLHDGDVEWAFYAEENPYFLNIPSDAYVGAYSYLTIRAYRTITAIYVYDDEAYWGGVDAIEYIDMGGAFNPAPMIAQTINDSAVFVWDGFASNDPSDNSAYQSRIDFLPNGQNGFVFECDGVVYDGFRIEVERTFNAGTSEIERYATRGGDVMVSPAFSSNYAIAPRLYYHRKADSNWILVWQLPYNGTDQGFNYWSYDGRWLSDSFRYVEIKADDGETGESAWLPTMTKSQLLALNNWQYGRVVAAGYEANIFTMVRQAFESVMPLLSVQILPYLSLGTLLFVPLVVIIVFAILKVLNK